MTLKTKEHKGKESMSTESKATERKEIEELRSVKNITSRATVPDLEEIMYQIFPVLDHGFVRVIDYMGDDSAIVQAARVSYGRGTKQKNEDQGLINYLMRHFHTTPFEMCEIKLHVKMPIFVARQWLRHRTANVNEYSARYSILDNEFYVPHIDHLASQSKTNKQGRAEVMSPEYSRKVLDILKKDAMQAYADYEYLLNEEDKNHDPERPGLARELARMNLPVNFYTQFYWKIDLHNLLRFLRLRADSHAQYEIRVYAQSMLEIMKKWVPLTHQAFMDYQFGGASLSEKALGVVKKMINGADIDSFKDESGMSKGEWSEFLKIFKSE